MDAEIPRFAQGDSVPFAVLRSQVLDSLGKLRIIEMMDLDLKLDGLVGGMFAKDDPSEERRIGGTRHVEEVSTTTSITGAEPRYRDGQGGMGKQPLAPATLQTLRAAHRPNLAQASGSPQFVNMPMGAVLLTCVVSEACGKTTRAKGTTDVKVEARRKRELPQATHLKSSERLFKLENQDVAALHLGSEG